MLSEQELNAIQARVEAATKGPWVVESQEGGYPGTWNYITGHVRAKAHTYSGGAGKSDSVTSPASMLARDAEFIAHSRVDVPNLLSEVRRLRAALAPYADEGSYHEQPMSLYSDVVCEPWIWLDQGEEARAALRGDPSTAGAGSGELAAERPTDQTSTEETSR